MATEINLPLAAAPFEKWTYDDVIREMKAVAIPDYEIKKAYAVDCDHYQEGAEWVGPGSSATTDKIGEQFAPEDAIGEALSNVENAFSEPQIGATPIMPASPTQEIPAATQTLIDDAVKFLSWWWDRQRLQEHIQERQHTAAWAGQAGLRLWIPWRFLTKNGETIQIRETSDFQEALSFIHVNAPLPESATVLTDPGTQDKVAVYLDEEYSTAANGERTTFKRAEMIFLEPGRTKDDEAKTIIRIVYSDTKRPTRRVELSLGGRLLFAEMRARALLTDPVIRTQRQLNLLTTLITRLAETAAFRERYTLNAKPQGYRLPYEEGEPLAEGAFLERDEEGRLWLVIPQARTLGANTTTELVGLPQYDEKGDMKGSQMPGVEVIEPVDPKPYLDAADSTRRRILRMSGQGHLGGISNAEASGIAYEQARAVFEKDLNKRRISEEGMLRDLLTAVLALAEQITGNPGMYTNNIRITVDQHIDAGPRSPDLVRLDIESFQASLLSEETAMARLGVEDIVAEQGRIRASVANVLVMIEKLSANTTLEPQGLIDLMRVAGVPERYVNTLKPKPEPEPVKETLAVPPQK